MLSDLSRRATADGRQFTDEKVFHHRSVLMKTIPTIARQRSPTTSHVDFGGSVVGCRQLDGFLVKCRQRAGKGSLRLFLKTTRAPSDCRRPLQDRNRKASLETAAACHTCSARALCLNGST